jgi:hypothetical protein
MTRYLFILAALLALCAGCETCDADNGAGCVPPIDDEATDTSAVVDEDAAVTDDMVPVAFEGRGSYCGGFDADNKVQPYLLSHCKETLQWEYDQLNLRLTILDKEMLLNCGYRPDGEVFSSPSGYNILEWVIQIGVKNCDCNFDYEVVLSGIRPGVFPLTVTRKYSLRPNDEAEVIWSGSLDLAQGSGTIPIKQENCP